MGAAGRSALADHPDRTGDRQQAAGNRQCGLARFRSIDLAPTSRLGCLMNERRPLTAEGVARVETALSRHGMLLMQGQWELPSVADLLEGRPITTRGFSWDYVTAWEHYAELAKRPDIADVKLFRGRSTLVARPLWPALNALGRSARDAVAAGRGGELQRRMLAMVESEPGVTGEGLRKGLAVDGRGFQRVKSDLAKWLCAWGTERMDVDYHTHDQAWYPWSRSKVAGAGGLRSAEEGVAVLIRAVYAGERPGKGMRVETLLPVTRWV